MPVIAQPSPCCSKLTLASVAIDSGVWPLVAEDERQRHREAARVRGADQLLGVRSRTVLHPRLERVGALEGAGAELHPAVAGVERALPLGVCAACRHGSSRGSLRCGPMSRGQRLTFLGIAAVIAVVAVILLAGGSGDDSDAAEQLGGHGDADPERDRDDGRRRRGGAATPTPHRRPQPKPRAAEGRQEQGARTTSRARPSASASSATRRRRSTSTATTSRRSSSRARRRRSRSRPPSPGSSRSSSKARARCSRQLKVVP